MTANYQLSRQYTLDFELLLKKCQEAIKICNFSLKESNCSSGYIKATAKLGWKSFGENIELWINNNGMVKARSTSSISTTFVDYGKNRENVEMLFKTLDALLGIETVQSSINLDMLSKPKERSQIFISYSHRDKEWLQKFQVMLKPAIRKQKITVWDDTWIKVGAKWRDTIENALAKAKIAVLMVSPNFLASDFIAEHELPPLLEAAEKDGVIIIWIYLSDCMYELTEIESYQAAHDISRPLDNLSPSELNSAIKSICKQILAATDEMLD